MRATCRALSADIECSLLLSMPVVIYWNKVSPKLGYEFATYRSVDKSNVTLLFRWNEVGYTREIQQRESRTGGLGIARYMWRERCAVCAARSARAALCDVCAAPDMTQRSAATLTLRLATASEHVQYCAAVSILQPCF